MTRIDEFKHADLNGAVPPKRPSRAGHNGRPATSLVGAVQVRHGREQATFTYNDGRTCKHPDGEKHDCAYVEARNRLIDRACQIASEHTRDKPGAFAREFMAAMTELARERGLIK